MAHDTNYQGYFVFESKGKISLAFGSSASRLRLAQSKDGAKFTSSTKPVELLSANGKTGSWKSLRDFLVTSGEKNFFLSFLKETPSAISLGIATSKNGFSWKIAGGNTTIKHPAIVLASGSAKKPLFLSYAATPRKFISLSVSKDLKKWEDRGVVLKPREHEFDALSLSPLYADSVKNGILLVYTARDGYGNATVGAALFDRDHPETMLWRSTRTLFSVPLVKDGKTIRFIGGVDRGKYFYVYTERDRDIEAFPTAKYWETYVPDKKSKTKKGKVAVPKKGIEPHRLIRHIANPILEPKTENDWEALATFNAAALHLGARVHLLYRAQGHDGVSVLGYAISSDGVNIEERIDTPVFVPKSKIDFRTDFTAPTFHYASGGGWWGGCEDPRICEIDGRIYLIYVAFNGTEPPGVALTSISTADFLARKWNWTTPRLISRKGQMHKNWVLFPEKINGKFAILHSISPRVLIDYVDDLDDPNLVIDSFHYRDAPDKSRWDNIVRGVGAPPIRTNEGWLVLYHAMDYRDPDKYKVGAMLLDLNDPTKILHRCHSPILEPEEEYENNGHKRGVVYVCGAVIKDKVLHVYYGASDRTLAHASAPLDAFLAALKTDKPTRLKKVKLE